MAAALEYRPDLREELDALFEGQSESVERAVRCMKVLAHPARLKVVCVLRGGEQTVQNLERYTGLPQATLSQHLAVLKDRGVLASRREGNFSLYRVAEPGMVRLFETIHDVFCAEAGAQAAEGRAAPPG